MIKHYVVTLEFFDDSISKYVVDSYASEWFVLQSHLAHKSNIKTHTIHCYDSTILY